MSRNNSHISHPPDPGPKRLRCAIYTRKSTEEGLEQEFNSLDAQRESAEAFIRSQRREGWTQLPDLYDDGGYSGANMERPALARLLREAEAGRIDCVVVYKVDRLSRSLLDFTKILSLFEKHNVSFVAVTQQFNTGTSLGRLTLNILLSFSQFERELIGERTRDKMAAAKRKGKWAGGYLVLGYDVAPGGGRLVVNDEEARRVRAIFTRFAANGSLAATLAEVTRRAWRLKSWTRKSGRFVEGSPFTANSLRRLLTNPLYKGTVLYKGESWPGEHTGIILPELWERVQQLIGQPGLPAGRVPRNKHQALLGGLLWCEACAARMVYSWSAKNSVRYFYYVCLNARRRGWDSCPAKSLPARVIEDAVITRLRAECGAAFDAQSWGRMDAPGQVDAVRRAVERIGYSAHDRSISIRFRPAGEQSR